MGAPPVVVLLDPLDDRAVMNAALAAHAPGQGCVTVHPTVGSRAEQQLAHDVLFSLGKSALQANVQQLPDAVGAWAAATTWARLRNITTMIVVRAHLLNAGQWQRLLELRYAAGLQLIMVYHDVELTSALRGCLGPVQHCISSDPAILGARRASGPSPASFTGGHASGVHDDAADDDEEPLPRVPAAALAWYRAEAYRRLSAAEFVRVDAVYRQGLRAACRWLSHQTRGAAEHAEVLPPVIDTPFPTGAALTGVDHFLGRDAASQRRRAAERRQFPTPWRDHGDLQVFLSGLVVDAFTPGHSVARIRGAQAGFLLHGLLLQPPEDLSTACGPGFGSKPFTRAAADRIREQIAHPIVATALALVLLTGQAPEVVARWDVPVDGETPLVAGGCHYAVPVHGRDLLGAAGLFRRLHSGRVARRLATVIGSDGGLLLPAARACGLALLADVPRRHGHDRPWHHLTGCWMVGPSLHESPVAGGLPAVPCPQKAT